LAECAKYDPHIFQRCAKEVVLSYQEATELACCELQATHSIRLGVSLNFTTFLHDFCKKENEACKLSKIAYDDAVAELDQVQDDATWTNACIILENIKQNLCQWVTTISTN
jgi:14-3-3 protein epsilon